jgi:hypothetical protein
MNRPAPLTGLHALARRALAFAGLGLLLYALLAAATEQLVRSTGHGNPFFKIATMQAPAVDWVILGTSHAMPLDFGGTRQDLQTRTGQLFVNLAATGTGPLYNRFVFEQFLAGHRTRNLLLVVDSFAFQSATWNEERFADAKLLARTPFEPALAGRLWQFVRHDGVAARAWLDYATSFSKLNNRDRFKEDRWEGEDQFDRLWRPSVSAVSKRMQYLYPDGTTPAARERYLGQLSRIIAAARQSGTRVIVVKLPTTAQYRGQLPDEPAFDAALARVLADADVPFHDFSGVLPQPRYYFDSDHLNRAGVKEVVDRYLLPLLTATGIDRGV